MSFWKSTSGNVSLLFGLTLLAVLMVVATAVDLTHQHNRKQDLQAVLDSATLAGALAEGHDHKRITVAKKHFEEQLELSDDALDSSSAAFAFNEDGILEGEATANVPLMFAGAFFKDKPTIRVNSEAGSDAPTSGPCIYILGNVSQALLINNGADVEAPDCEIHVHSKKPQTFVQNAGTSLKISTMCVKGTNKLKNGGFLTDYQMNCDAAPDPYDGVMPAPSVPASCDTTGAFSITKVTLKPGRHCSVNFNLAADITFEKGLHIIDGPMVIAPNSTITAEGVTFYFPDMNSHLRVNGALSMTASAPETGTYAGILMFEPKIATATVDTMGTTQYIFNGSKGETLQGLIYLPNRQVVYNSTTNVDASAITLVAHTMIMNTANWSLDYPGGEGGQGRSGGTIRIMR